MVGRNMKMQKRTNTDMQKIFPGFLIVISPPKDEFHFMVAAIPMIVPSLKLLYQKKYIE